MTPVLVLCDPDGTPFVWPDGSIHCVVPGADIDLTEHMGQCEVRAMVLAAEPVGGHALRRESSPIAADLDEIERRDSVSPAVAALWPATQCRSELEADG